MNARVWKAVLGGVFLKARSRREALDIVMCYNLTNLTMVRSYSHMETVDFHTISEVAKFLASVIAVLQFVRILLEKKPPSSSLS